MTITSLTFAGFVIVVLALYYLLPRRRWQNYLLLVASYCFYVTWAWQFALVLVALTLFNFWAARRLGPGRPHSRNWLWVGIGLNVLVLAFFKYANFFVPEAVSLLGYLGIPVPSAGILILLPLGLSFRVLETISYLVDVSRGQTPATDNLVDFALYVAYFPKLVAGPIERARSFLPKLKKPSAVDNGAVARSLTLIVVGLLRKVVIADVLFNWVPPEAFVTPLQFSPPRLFVWMVQYAFALYNDFAGYTDIVRGVSGFFGIELSPNFSAPFFSRNFTEFWSRWHITLSSWLRDYIYFPLSRAFLRRNPSPTNLLNLVVPGMTTMLVSGLWHGTGLNVLVWGALNGVYLVAERALTIGRPVVPPGKRPLWRQGLAMVTVTLLAMLAAVPFRMELPIALSFWSALFRPFDWHELGYLRTNFALLMGLSLCLDWVQYRRKDEAVFLRWPRLAQSALLALAAIAVFLASRATPTGPFVYQGF